MYIIDFEFENHEEMSPKVTGKMDKISINVTGYFAVNSSDGIPSCQKFPVSIVTENSSPIYPEPDLKLLFSEHQTFHCLFISLLLATHYAMAFPSFQKKKKKHRTLCVCGGFRLYTMALKLRSDV
jgi:hypothetical protein